jgi:uncharacterized protein YndB with AHSA1/START domain
VSPAHNEQTTVIVRRVIPAPRERVFDAWLDPVRLAAFMRPSSVTRTTAEVDPRVGGRFRIVMYHPAAGAAGTEHTGEYLLIDRPHRLAFTWRSINTDDAATEVTIEFLAHGSDTEVVLTHKHLPQRTAESHRTGWSGILAGLGEVFR